MRASSAAIGISVLAFGISAAGSPEALRASFHHIHVNDNRPDSLLSYYDKLFDRSTTQRAAIGDVRGIEAGGVFLLVRPVKEEPPEEGGAGWHFGWGAISLDEAYDQHRMREADLKLPIPSFAHDLHVHIESEDPVAAALWYRDRFDARISTRSKNAEVTPVNSYFRRPAAIVEFPGISFAIYKAMRPLVASRGHRIDHVAFKADVPAARAAGFTVLEASGRLGSFETMTVEGPDKLAIELVGDPHSAVGNPLSAQQAGCADSGSRTADRGR